MTLQEFISRAKIAMTAERVDSNPHMDASDMDHWRCKFRSGRKAMTVYFSMGYGHKGKAPKADEVLDCLISDASSVETSRSFEDWAGDLGYDADSRKAERIYRACERTGKRLRRFLGDDGYSALNDAERL